MKESAKCLAIKTEVDNALDLVGENRKKEKLQIID